MLGISADGRPGRPDKSLALRRAHSPAATRCERQQRAERDPDAGADQALLDRVAHQKYAAERERDAADPDDPAGAEPLLEADRARRCRQRPLTAGAMVAAEVEWAVLPVCWPPALALLLPRSSELGGWRWRRRRFSWRRRRRGRWHCLCASTARAHAARAQARAVFASRRRMRLRCDSATTSATMAMTGKARAASTRMTERNRTSKPPTAPKSAPESMGGSRRAKGSMLAVRRHAFPSPLTKSFLNRSR